MIVAGLTGGIATGKSTVSTVFEEAGAIVIDADKIARDVVKKGRPAWQKIVTHFGQAILRPDGEIDRPRLAGIVFNDREQKLRLNRIVHPHVAEETSRRLKQIEQNRPDAVVILDVPLLLETGMDKGLAEVIVVYAPEDAQLERLMARDKLSKKEALSRIESQMPIENKKSSATIVIDNSTTRESARKQALDVFRHLQEKCRHKTS